MKQVYFSLKDKSVLEYAKNATTSEPCLSYYYTNTNVLVLFLCVKY